MPRKLEFATGGSGDGANEKKINVVYPPEVQRKLDDALGVVEKAGSAACLRRQAERAAALKAYKRLVDVAVAEQQERMKLVDFRGEQIHNFELQALQKIVEQINADYAEQRKADPGFYMSDVVVADLGIGVEGEKVVKIDLSGRKLKKIPEAIGALINLQVLWLNVNQITKISGLENLTKLSDLDLSVNQITEISGLRKLTNLYQLRLSDNQISEIRGLEKLTDLQWLDLGDNQITEISGLEGLKELTDLYLSKNQITEISGLEGLINLLILDLGQNQITEISGLDDQKDLRWLGLVRNSIDECIPANAAELERLRRSDVEVII